MDFIKKIVLVSLFILFASSTANAKNCKKGIPCGNSCISATKTCRIGTYSKPSEPKVKAPPSPSNKQTISKQNFDNAKKQLVQLYKSYPQQTTFYCGCDFSFSNKSGVVDFKDRKFQPREEIRGVIARTYFYMSDKYKINLSDSERKLMTVWNKTHPPENWECERNKLIKQIQGNDNKFVAQQCK